MQFPRTPRKNGEDLRSIINHLNEKFALDLPNPLLYSPSVHQDNKSHRWRSYRGIKRLYFGHSNLNCIINDFEEWVSSRQVPTHVFTSFPAAAGLNGNPGGDMFVSAGEKEERMKYFAKLVDDAIYLLNGGSFSSFASRRESEDVSTTNQNRRTSPLKRRFSDEDDEDFHTAPNSPEKNTEEVLEADQLVSTTFDNADFALDYPAFNGVCHAGKSPMLSPSKGMSFIEKLTTPDRPQYYDIVTREQDRPRFGFSTTTETSSFLDDSQSRLDTSFSTEITEPLEDEDLYEGSTAAHNVTQEITTPFHVQENIRETFSRCRRLSTDQAILDELIHRGPFSTQQSFPASVPMRYRYELERIGRAWNVPSSRMLVGKNISFSHQDFWKWIERHSQRDGKPLPEKSSRAAWDAATGDFKTGKHSEEVALTGDLIWCNESEPGIFKLKLNPLRTERSCRFHRRFGADRFLTLTIPAAARPPNYLRITSNPTALREGIGSWLTQNVHRCMGRTWRPFYVEEVKIKRKSKASEPKFKVEFFAIDGVDFDHSPLTPPIAPYPYSSDRHVPMSLDSFIEWHLPREANIDQSDCKLFQRFSLGLSKTFATITLEPSQVLPLTDDPNRPVMNDGCALMSRGLANAICDCLGISGNTPSCFQGRFAGAKGLWMVDRHQSRVSAGDNDFWIQVSDSQLKIKPHPQLWRNPVDPEQLRFEVVKWSKPLHPVDLNVQLLGILEYGGHIKEYVAELTRSAIQNLYDGFAEVLQSNSNVLCRSLIQKVCPAAGDASGPISNTVRRLEQWAMNDAESIIRLVEAGFAPRDFYPLRKRLAKCLRNCLDRFAEELHIEVPLSTYAFCIADPYAVLNEDEVHFGFSSNWRDPDGHFEDNLLDGIDVLVGRLPAHLPSDIQRRRAVWKPELRHFKDVIVFPTKGDIPLAHMLSGGDYDGDTPWICWDQNIVQNFTNSDLPTEDYPPEHFGLTKHSIPMRDVPTTDEFLRRAFTFNLTLSNLGRCTVEHERICYDESIDSSRAKELACLLSHLVDGRKGGVHLSEQAWQKYRKTISPMARGLPAYRNPERKYKPSNIIDYLKFEVATQERHAVLEKLEKAFPQSEHQYSIDEDLARPWDTVWKSFEDDKRKGIRLHEKLADITTSIERHYRKWFTSVQMQNEYSAAREATESVRAIRPPPDDHPIFHTWQTSEPEWQRLLASCTYRRYAHSSFTFHAFGETLCQMKACCLPSRTITNDILACYKVNQRTVRQFTAKEFDDRATAEDGFDDEDAIEMMLYGGQVPGVPGGYYDPDDSMSVE